MNSFQELGGRLLVIFDGRCGFCNQSVRWFLVHDRRDRLRFAPSESPKVAELLARHSDAASDSALSSSTLIVGRNPGSSSEKLFIRSDAALALLEELPRPWPAIATALRMIPRPLRDLGYWLIARSRYHIGGQLQTCPLPTPRERAHFV